MFLLNKQGYFAGTDVFYVPVVNGGVLSFWALLILISCGRFHSYVLVLFVITVMMLVFCSVF
jgi:hypothetical protein